MDRQMDALWSRAQKRIDYALAGMCACGLWVLVLPLVVLLTDMRWSSLFHLCLLAALPLGLVFLRPLESGRLVARAIAERDADELARWRETSVPPAHPELLRRRMRGPRVRMPVLVVVAAMAGLVTVLALLRRTAPDYPAMAQYSLGIALASAGVCLSAIVQMFRRRAANRVILAGHILVIWTVPLGIGIASIAMIVGRQDIASAVAVRTMTAMVYVIFGLVGVLVTVVMAALWFALVTVLFSAPKTFDDEAGLREVLRSGRGKYGGPPAAGEAGAGTADAGTAGTEEAGVAGAGAGAEEAGAGTAGAGGAGAGGAGVAGDDGAAAGSSAGADNAVADGAAADGGATTPGSAAAAKNDAAPASGPDSRKPGSKKLGWKWPGSRRPDSRKPGSKKAGPDDAGRLQAAPQTELRTSPQDASNASDAPGTAQATPGIAQAAPGMAQDDGPQAASAPAVEPEFDEADVQAVRAALLVERSQWVLAGVIVVATAAILALAFADLAGTGAHVAAGVVLAISLTFYVRRPAPR